MQMRWNLDKLYTSFESEKFIIDLEKLDTEIREIIKWADDSLMDNLDAEEKICWWITKENNLGHLYSRLSSYAALVFSVDASNDTAKKYEELLDVKLTALT